MCPSSIERHFREVGRRKTKGKSPETADDGEDRRQGGEDRQRK